MQVTLLRVPMPGKPEAGKGYAHNDLLCVQLRSGKSPDTDAIIEASVESLCLTANRLGQIIQVTLPANSIGKSGTDPRVEMAIAKLFGRQFARWLSKKAGQEIGWESGPHLHSQPRKTRKVQREIMFWLDAKGKELKRVQLAEFVSRSEWALENQDVAENPG